MGCSSHITEFTALKCHGYTIIVVLILEHILHLLICRCTQVGCSSCSHLAPSMLASIHVCDNENISECCCVDDDAKRA